MYFRIPLARTPCIILVHNEELLDPHSPSTIIRVIKSSKIFWAEHVARTDERKVDTGFWWGNPRERDHFEDLGVDGRVILK